MLVRRERLRLRATTALCAILGLVLWGCAQRDAESDDSAFTSASVPDVSPPGQARFEPADSTRIEQVARLMLQQPRLHVLIEGHTDDRGSEAANQRLSRERAEAVERALVERGINPGQVRTRGLGESQPAHDNDTEEGRRLNRRVELLFSDSDGRFLLAADQVNDTGAAR